MFLLAIGIFVLAVAASYLSEVNDIYERDPSNFKWKKVLTWNLFLNSVLVATTGIIFTVCLSLVFTNHETVLSFLIRTLGLYGTRIFVASLTITLGLIAFKWKDKNKYSYGVGEIIFGCIVAAYIPMTIEAGKPLLSQWVGLGGAAYVIARGLNNVSEAKAGK